jgi:micrococcal nuclease
MFPARRVVLMNKLLAATICIAIFAGAASAETQTVRVIGVKDGDTIECRTISGPPQTIRLSGIDAPEKKQPFGERAKQYTSKTVMGKTVVIETYGRDRYGRIIADVRVRSGTLNEELVRNGLAWWYQKYSHDRRLRDAEFFARKQKVGLWTDTTPQPPWEYRRQKPGGV